jgi:hypothetical protein
MAKPQVTDVDFVKACVNSKTAEAVASATGLKHSTVLSRAAKLRKAGVNLPEFDRAKKVLDVKALNALIPAAPPPANPMLK